MEDLYFQFQHVNSFCAAMTGADAIGLAGNTTTVESTEIEGIARGLRATLDRIHVRFGRAPGVG